jgi:hypothetical protein
VRVLVPYAPNEIGLNHSKFHVGGDATAGPSGEGDWYWDAPPPLPVRAVPAGTLLSRHSTCSGAGVLFDGESVADFGG